MNCNRALCPGCSTQRAADARRTLAPLAQSAESVLVLRLSLSTSASLDDAWLALEATRKALTTNAWLTKRSTAWYAQKELTLSPTGWNLHLQILLFDPAPSLAHDARRRWVELATAAGHRAALSGQYAETWSNPRKAVAYTVKGLLHQKKNEDRRPGDGLSPGDLLALFHAGDVDAAERWQELETFVSSARRRWHEQGGTLRKAKS